MKNKIGLLLAFTLIITSCGDRALFIDEPSPDYRLEIYSNNDGDKAYLPFTLSGVKGDDITGVTVTGAYLPKGAVLAGSAWTVDYQAVETSRGAVEFTVYGKKLDGTIVATQSIILLVVNTNDIPDDPFALYYEAAYGLSGDSLKSTLHEIINDHHVFPYTSSSTDIWDILKVLDKDPGNPGNVLCIYSRSTIDSSLQDPGGGGWDAWNREHSWPKSYGFNDDDWPAYTDVHHLRAVIATVNSTRNNTPFGDGGVSLSNNLSAPIYVDPTCYYNGGTSFEPPDEVKGDIARQMFYMAVRYEGDRVDETDLELTNETANLLEGLDINTTYYMGDLDTLLIWNVDDPVSAEEMLRNNLIYSNYQSNRNPFIDYPEWITNIWN